jgi:hypothetical protein
MDSEKHSMRLIGYLAITENTVYHKAMSYGWRAVLLLVGVFALFLAQRATAATIIVNTPDTYGRTFIDVVGEILPGDDKTFEQKVVNLYKLAQRSVIVTLASPGGSALTAMAIGELIKTRGWTTYVPSGTPCASACGLIWLAGAPHTIEAAPGVLIGFHAAYDNETHKEVGTANALVGAYITNLGLGYDTVVCVTAAEPQSIAWLTARFPCGITWEALTPAREVPLSIPRSPPAPPQPPPPQPPPAAQPKPTQILAVGVQDLHLRQNPDPRAADVLGYFMPAGSQVIIIDRCQIWTASGRGAQDADNIWCPVRYGSYSGWVNALYLALGDGRSVACVLYPSAQGC